VIQNATLLRIDTPGPASTGGDLPYVEGASIAVRCCLSSPNSMQRWTIDQLQLQATATLYVRLTDLATAVLDRTFRVLVTLDHDASVQTSYRVEHVTKQYKGELSHLQCLLREI
jgi:hypothetical protein